MLLTRWWGLRVQLPSQGASHPSRTIGLPTQLATALTLFALVSLSSGCGPFGHSYGVQTEPTKTGAQKSVSIRGSVVDAASHKPVEFAHVSYNHQVVSSDAGGGFAFDEVPANLSLSVVAGGYRRYNSIWKPEQPQIALAPLEIRGLYLPLTGLDDPTMLASVDRYTQNTEINAVVLEIKTDDGQVSAQMATPEALSVGAVVQGYNVKGFVQKMHERNVYVIGRFVVFRDPVLAAAHPEYTLRRLSNGQPYADEQGEKWIDAFRQEVWQYELDLAEQGAQLGIDEIQFDYVRFPGTDQPLQFAEHMTPENRIAAISGFLKRAETRLRPYGIAIGADTFGLTAIATDDQGIGQDITSLGPYIDYYSPMVYPSTWAPGSLGIDYPPAQPYTIVLDSVQSAVKRLSGIPTVRVRPWLQAFDDYQRGQIDYTPDRINTQKDAAEKAGATGWMLWDPGGRYEAGVISPAETQAGQALR
jgi:hypothetical protein